jgi:peptide chain release factor subunit 1
MNVPLERDALRELSAVRAEDGLVISAYLDLDPAEFATPAARSSAIRSLIGQAEKRAEELDALSHEQEQVLRGDIARLRDQLEGGGLPKLGARAVAVFCSTPADLLETIALPYSVPSRVVIDRRPSVAPLVDVAHQPRWCVVLVDRRRMRVFRGTHDALVEERRLEDDVHGQHDQGGWSQARYERAVEEEVDDHLRHVAAELTAHLRREPFERLLLGGPHELASRTEMVLDAELRRLVAGHVEVDVEAASADDVLAAAAPVMVEDERRAELEIVRRIVEGVATDGRGAGGLAAVLEALAERRVETLAFEEGRREPGTSCPRCGWLGTGDAERCPADGSALDAHPNVLEPAIAVALAQDARVLIVRHHRDLGPLGGVAAALRF